MIARKGRSRAFSHNLAAALQLLPTPMTSDAKGAGKDRFLGSPTYRNNLREALRESENDGIYPHPEFVEAMMGFPTGWTDLER